MDLNMDLNARFGDASFGIGGGIVSGIGGGGLGLREAPGQGSAFSMDLDSSLFGGGNDPRCHRRRRRRRQRQRQANANPSTTNTTAVHRPWGQPVRQR